MESHSQLIMSAGFELFSAAYNYAFTVSGGGSSTNRGKI